jgi:RHS repeat-associated protein
MIIRYYQADRNGKSSELTNVNGTVHWRGCPSVWGNTWVEHGARGSHQPLRFQGQYFDGETGLHYNLHRYYDPDAGRFTSQDPIGLRGGVNVYRYAPNPLGWADPLGLMGVGLNYLSAASPSCAFGRNVDLGSGTFGVLANGTLGGYAARVGNLTINPSDMARDIQNSPNYRRGQSIMLFACNTGRDGERSFGQKLADHTGEEVYAPTDRLLRSPDGTCGVLNGGTWDLFFPRPGSRR